jgi:very-short-patch-repair endonuclease
VTRLALSFDRQCQLAGLPIPVAEFRFHPVRKWRFDFAFIAVKLAIEVDGGAFVQGRHTRGAGWLKDQEKLNTATVLGWRVLHVTPKQVADGTALTWVSNYFQEQRSA